MPLYHKLGDFKKRHTHPKSQMADLLRVIMPNRRFSWLILHYYTMFTDQRLRDFKILLKQNLKLQLVKKNIKSVIIKRV
jgi:hypothetical protein